MLVTFKQPDPLYEEIGARIRARRTDLKLSQVQLADMMMLTRSSVANIESGRQGLTAESIIDLCLGLKVSADWLLGLAEPGPLLEDPIRRAAARETVAVFRRAFAQAAAEATGQPGR